MHCRQLEQNLQVGECLGRQYLLILEGWVCTVRFSHSENLGEVVVYQWVEWIKDYITSKAEELQGAAHANSRSLSIPQANIPCDSLGHSISAYNVMIMYPCMKSLSLAPPVCTCLGLLQRLWLKPRKKRVLQVVERTVIVVVLDLEVKTTKQHCHPEHLFMKNDNCNQFVLPSCTVNLSLTGRALSRHMLPWWQLHKRYEQNGVGTSHLHIGMFWYHKQLNMAVMCFDTSIGDCKDSSTSLCSLVPRPACSLGMWLPPSGGWKVWLQASFQGS